MIAAFAKLNPSAFSLDNIEPPQAHNFNMPEQDQEDDDDTDFQSSPTTYQPQTSSSLPQHEQNYGFRSFAQYSSPQFPFSNVASTSHFHGASSSQIHGSVPSMFATNLNTPISAFQAQQCYRPILPSSSMHDGDDDDDEEDEEEDDEEDEEEDEEEEVPQLIRQNRRRPREIPDRVEQQRRVQPARQRNPPPCGTSSHHRRRH